MDMHGIDMVGMQGWTTGEVDYSRWGKVTYRMQERIATDDQ